MPALRIPSEADVREIPPERILSRVGWVTEPLRRHEHGADRSEERRRERVASAIADYLIFYTNAVHFMQDHGFTTRQILSPDEHATAMTTVRASDLTLEGLRFYYYGIRGWMNALDRAKNKHRAATNVAYLDRKLREFRAHLDA